MVKEFYVVKLERPPGVTVGEMSAYIREAVNAWSGQFEPQNPLFDLKPVTVKRFSIRRPKYHHVNPI